LSRSYLKWIIEYVHVNEVAAPINLTVNVDTSVPTVPLQRHDGHAAT